LRKLVLYVIFYFNKQQTRDMGKGPEMRRMECVEAIPPIQYEHPDFNFKELCEILGFAELLDCKIEKQLLFMIDNQEITRVHKAPSPLSHFHQFICKEVAPGIIKIKCFDDETFIKRLETPSRKSIHRIYSLTCYYDTNRNMYSHPTMSTELLYQLMYLSYLSEKDFDYAQQNCNDISKKSLNFLRKLLLDGRRQYSIIGNAQTVSKGLQAWRANFRKRYREHYARQHQKHLQSLLSNGEGISN
jgi:hypothetical protein